MVSAENLLTTTIIRLILSCSTNVYHVYGSRYILCSLRDRVVSRSVVWSVYYLSEAHETTTKQVDLASRASLETKILQLSFMEYVEYLADLENKTKNNWFKYVWSYSNSACLEHRCNPQHITWTENKGKRHGFCLSITLVAISLQVSAALVLERKRDQRPSVEEKRTRNEAK